MAAELLSPPTALESAAVLPEEESGLEARFAAIRRWTDNLCEPLATEDFVIQAMPDASPVKWHLAHTSWFFETFVLQPHWPGYQPFHPEFGFLFNSYYNAVGPRWPRFQRGLLSRPTVAEVFRYRGAVDQAMHELFQPGQAAALRRARDVIELGLHHEQQHQELILTDLKYLLACNPLHPVYRESGPPQGRPPRPEWVAFPEGLAWIGHEGSGFAFDNEGPRHRVFLPGFRLASRLVTNGAYLEFIEAGGYQRPEFWLSDGWAARQAQEWTAPLYWEQPEAGWQVQTLSGFRPVDPAEPVCHVSFFEADAFARWAGARLPAEAEWETAAAAVLLAGHFLESEHYHPATIPAPQEPGPLYQLFGDVWQWTASPFLGYPGYQPLAGALGEYNGKFMCNQFVLRGASCATPRSHARRTYRNFFGPAARWQFSGIRLAQDLPA